MPADKTIDTVLLIIAGGLLSLGLGSMLIGWLVRQWDMLMSRSAAGDADQNSNENRPIHAISLDETNNGTREIPQWVAEMIEESFHSGENTAIARLIVADVVKLTEGVREGTGKRSGDAYSKRSKEIKAEVERLKKPEFPALAAQQRQSIVEKV